MFQDEEASLFLEIPLVSAAAASLVALKIVLIGLKGIENRTALYIVQSGLGIKAASALSYSNIGTRN